MWTIDPAPEAHDIAWSNLAISFHQRFVRTWLIAVATFALVLFWVIPVAFVASLTTLENLSSKLPFLNPVINLNVAVKGQTKELCPLHAVARIAALI